MKWSPTSGLVYKSNGEMFTASFLRMICSTTGAFSLSVCWATGQAVVLVILLHAS